MNIQAMYIEIMHITRGSHGYTWCTDTHDWRFWSRLTLSLSLSVHYKKWVVTSVHYNSAIDNFQF